MSENINENQLKKSGKKMDANLVAKLKATFPEITKVTSENGSEMRMRLPDQEIIIPFNKDGKMHGELLIKTHEKKIKIKFKNGKKD